MEEESAVKSWAGDAVSPESANWMSGRFLDQGLGTCQDGDSSSRNRRPLRRNGASPSHRKTFSKTVVIMVLCFLLLADCLASPPNDYRNRRTRLQQRLRRR